jgi:ubiquinol-cytochrome c reductase cytochrome c subunit
VRLMQKLSSRLAHRIAGRLSAGRRSRIAAPLVLLLGLLVTGGMYAALSPATAQSKAADEDMVAKGRALFLVGCASCHGKNAEGIPTVKGGQYGPSLIGVGAASVDFQVGTGRMPLAQPGTQALRKPPVYDAEEIEALAAYVASLGPGPDVPAASRYDTSDVENEDIVRGGEFFRTNCTACHNFAGNGGALPRGRFAPALNGVSNKHIYEAMLTGPQQMPVFSDEVLSPQDKQQIIAYLKKNEETPNYGGFTLGSLGPVSEGLFAWLVGIGTLVGAAVWIGANSTRSRKKINS